jgi:hypothetical protein
LDKWPAFTLQDWPRFVFAAFQSAFYIGSLSCVPRFTGYTTAFMAVHCGSLVTSSICDATGTLGRRIPFSVSRAIALMFVVSGVWLFSRASAEELKDTSSCAEDTAVAEEQERQGLTSGERNNFSPRYGDA